MSWGLNPPAECRLPPPIHHCATDWSSIRASTVLKFSNFDRFSSQNLQTLSANCFSFWGISSSRPPNVRRPGTPLEDFRPQTRGTILFTIWRTTVVRPTPVVRHLCDVEGYQRNMSHVRQPHAVVNKAYRGDDRGRTICVAAAPRQTLVNSPQTSWLQPPMKIPGAAHWKSLEHVQYEWLSECSQLQHHIQSQCVLGFPTAKPMWTLYVNMIA